MVMSVMTYRLGVVETHPIQYKAPLFRYLSRLSDLELTVMYALMPDRKQQSHGFGVEFEWDGDLLAGYRSILLENVSRMPCTHQFKGCDTPGIGRVMDEAGFDAILVNGWVVKSCLQALWAGRRRGIPVLVRGESNVLRSRRGWKTLVHRLLLSQYSAFLAIGSSNRRFYLDRGVPAERVFSGPYCVDHDAFVLAADTARQARGEMRRRWGIPSESTCLMFCGKLDAKKHPLDVLQALHRLVVEAAGASAWHLLIVGDGPERVSCEHFAETHGLPVTCAGFMNQSKLPGAYAAADCLVLPSDAGETWGLVVNEAMACGLPAIVSDRVGCAEDLIVPRRTGGVYPFGDIPALSGLLAELARDREGLRVMGHQARAHVAKYHFSAVAEGLRAALASCVGRRSAGVRMGL